MKRACVIIGLAAVLLTTALQAQQKPIPVAGKWEVNIDRRPIRIADLTVQGSVVKGTITKPNSTDTIAVTGELRAVELIFWTPEKEETFGVIAREGEPVQGTYMFCPAGRPSGECAKSAVTMKRPAK